MCLDSEVPNKWADPNKRAEWKSPASKVHIFWEGRKILQNLYCRFDRYYIGQIYEIPQKFVAFSDYMKFKSRYILIYSSIGFANILTLQIYKIECCY